MPKSSLEMSPTFRALSQRLRAQLLEPMSRIEQSSQAARSSSTRCGFYDYLADVMRARKQWRRAGLRPLAKRILKEMIGKKQSADIRLTRLLIDVTAPWADAKARSRWSRALDYALQQSVTPNRLIRFLRMHGGAAGCAASAALDFKLKKSRDSDWIEE